MTGSFDHGGTLDLVEGDGQLGWVVSARHQMFMLNVSGSKKPA